MTRTLSAVALLALVACGDSRLGKLAINMPKDSVTQVMGAPHRTANFMFGGKVWEFAVYKVGNPTPITATVKLSSGADTTITDSIPWRTMSPVVTIEGKVVGWGWGWWDKEAAKLGISLVPEAK